MTAVAGSIALFGGFFRPNGLFFGDTWRFDGEHWTQVQDIGPARFSHTMIFDSTRGALVLFGGTGATEVTLGDTWEHNT
jgi:hypothetical protein